MSSSSKGAAGEKGGKAWLEAQGWWVSERTASSKGLAELIAIRPAAVAVVKVSGIDTPSVCEVLFVQVKCNRGSPYMNFRAEERIALRAEAVRAGATAALLHLERPPIRVDGRWVVREPPLLVPSHAWPSSVVS